MENVFDIIEECSDRIDVAVRAMRSGRADEFGLDRRSASLIFTDGEIIVVHESDDRSLQYYGGFEYIDSEFRLHMGQWVIYMRDDDRVQDCIDAFYEKEEVEAE
jgi:hypothetical protein